MPRSIKDNVNIVKFSYCKENKKYQPNYPVRMSSNGLWVNYGKYNLDPQYFVELYETSPTHCAIVNRKAEMASGDIVTEGLDASLIQFVDTAYDGRGLQELINRCIFDLILYGGFCIQVLFYKNRRQIKDILYQDFCKVRRGFDRNDTEDNYKAGIWISADWRRFNISKVNTPHFFEYFDREVLTNDNLDIPQEPVFLYYYIDSADRDWYPRPSWIAGYKAIQGEAALFAHLNASINNSFNPSGILEIPNILSPEEGNELKNQVNIQLTGPDNSGKLFIVQSDGEKKTNWIPLNPKPSDAYSETAERLLESAIIKSHGLISPTIIGLPGGASLGGDGGTIEKAAELFQKTTINKIRQEFLKQLNVLIQGAGFSQKITLM